MGDYGVGIIKGRDIGLQVNAERPKHVRGPLVIDGVTFTAASGSVRVYGCPYGTYTLSLQRTGSIIRRHYSRLHLHGPLLGIVWNVGCPGKITSIGYDPGVVRNRRAIQIHCSPPMKSSGCVVMNLNDFRAFAEIMMRKDDMVLEVAPSKNEGAVEFLVFPKQDW